MSVFGGKLHHDVGRSPDGRGIVTVRPNVATAAAAASPGHDRGAHRRGRARPCRRCRVVERVAEAGAAASIEEARIIVAGGRGVGGPDGFELVEELAEALGGAVGATRAAVDSGWIPYSQQIGQTGKIVKPELYLALGISGAIQHKVGMQTAGTIVAVNRDPDAPDRRVRRPVRRRRPVRGRQRAARPASRPVGLSAAGRRTTMRTRRSCCRSRPSSALAVGAGRRPAAARAGSSRGRARSSSSSTRVRDLAARVDASLGGAASQIDAVRRRQLGPDDDRRHHRGGDRRGRALRGRGARAPRPADGATDPRPTSSAELERARRALGMVEHGATILARRASRLARARGADLDQARLPQPPPRPRGDRPPCARGRRRCEAPTTRPQKAGVGQPSA